MTPIERERGQRLPVAARWDLYRMQRGRDWRDFLTREEYDRYLREFAFIRELRPLAEYRAALRARDDYERIKSFTPTYHQVSNAVAQASLSLDRQGNLQLEVGRQNLIQLVTEATAKEILGAVGGHLTKLILGRNILGPLGLILDVRELYNSIQNQRLVGAVGREADAARYRKKLSLILDIKAADFVKGTGANPAQFKDTLHKLYREYQEVFYRYAGFVEQNRLLDPNLPRWERNPPPQFRSR